MRGYPANPMVKNICVPSWKCKFGGRPPFFKQTHNRSLSYLHAMMHVTYDYMINHDYIYNIRINICYKHHCVSFPWFKCEDRWKPGEYLRSSPPHHTARCHGCGDRARRMSSSWQTEPRSWQVWGPKLRPAEFMWTNSKCSSIFCQPPESSMPGPKKLPIHIIQPNQEWQH